VPVANQRLAERRIRITYEVDERAQTITRHVDGSITRGLIGQSLTRAYRFSDGGLTMRSVRPEERWSTMWVRY